MKLGFENRCADTGNQKNRLPGKFEKLPYRHTFDFKIQFLCSKTCVPTQEKKNRMLGKFEKLLYFYFLFKKKNWQHRKSKKQVTWKV